MRESHPFPLYIPPSMEQAVRAEHDGQLPEGVEVLKKIPGITGRFDGIRLRPRPQFVAMPHRLAVCIEAATREHNPFPIAPIGPTWAAAGVLLLCMQTLERASRPTTMTTTTQGASL